MERFYFCHAPVARALWEQKHKAIKQSPLSSLEATSAFLNHVVTFRASPSSRWQNLEMGAYIHTHTPAPSASHRRQPTEQPSLNIENQNNDCFEADFPKIRIITAGLCSLPWNKTIDELRDWMLMCKPQLFTIIRHSSATACNAMTIYRGFISFHTHTHTRIYIYITVYVCRCVYIYIYTQICIYTQMPSASQIPNTKNEFCSLQQGDKSLYALTSWRGQSVTVPMQVNSWCNRVGGTDICVVLLFKLL